MPSSNKRRTLARLMAPNDTSAAAARAINVIANANISQATIHPSSTFLLQ